MSQPQQTTIIHTSQPVGPSPSRITCPSCHAQITTTVRHDVSTKTHIMAVLLCGSLCWPCVCIPYYTDSCRNTNHYCPSCESFLGTYS